MSGLGRGCRKSTAASGNSPALYSTLRTVLWAAGGEIPPADPAALIGARTRLVEVQRTLANQIRGILKTFGQLVGSAVGTRLPTGFAS
jgi:hypothetical protein